MDKKGFWALLASVSKAWKTIFTRTNDSFRYRQAAGDDNILLPEKNGRAVIDTIYGKTIKWNQLMHNGECTQNSYPSVTRLSYATIDFDTNGMFITNTSSSNYGGILILNNTELKQGHVYLLEFDIKQKTSNSQYRISIAGVSGTSYNTPVNWERRKYIISNTASATGIYLYIVTPSYQIYFRNITIFDLTEIFGAGNEPSTVADVEAWLALNVGEQDYYPYDAGSLVNFNGQGVKSVGFNQWDEEWEAGRISETDGKTIRPSQAGIYSVNYIPVFGGQKYYFRYPYSSGGLVVLQYDVDKNFITPYVGGTNTEITLYSNTRYIRFYTTAANTAAGINVNLSWSGYRNGEYKPYEEHTLYFNGESGSLATVTGKKLVDGEPTGESVTIFPEGMKSAGTVYDFGRADSDGYIRKVTKRIGSVDLNNLSWTDYSNSFIYATGPSDMTRIELSPNGACNKYQFVQVHYSAATAGMIWLNDNAFSGQKPRIYIKETDTSKLVGATLYYELETPEEYLLDTPVPAIYDNVVKNGTEELLVPASVSGEPTSTAIVADINYQITGHNYIDDLFVDMGLPSGTLWAKCDIDITKPNGFCDTPFTYEKTFFSWGNIDGHNPTSTSSFSPYNWGSVNAQAPWYDGQVYGSTKGNTLQADIPTNKEYDAAMANLGQLFKMPSSTQFQELINNCIFIDANGDEIPSTTTDKRVTVNGIVGLYLQSMANDNRLFFSASGYGDGSSCSGRGAYGYYCSTSFYSARNSRYLYFRNGGVIPQGNGNRYYGLAIRPIKNQ